jgi:hypothetical protein
MAHFPQRLLGVNAALPRTLTRVPNGQTFAPAIPVNKSLPTLIKWKFLAAEERLFQRKNRGKKMERFAVSP